MDAREADRLYSQFLRERAAERQEADGGRPGFGGPLGPYGFDERPGTSLPIRDVIAPVSRPATGSAGSPSRGRPYTGASAGGYGPGYDRYAPPPGEWQPEPDPGITYSDLYNPRSPYFNGRGVDEYDEYGRPYAAGPAPPPQGYSSHGPPPPGSAYGSRGRAGSPTRRPPPGSAPPPEPGAYARSPSPTRSRPPYSSGGYSNSGYAPQARRAPPPQQRSRPPTGYVEEPYYY
eukprot:tig00020553_g10772.t1